MNILKFEGENFRNLLNFVIEPDKNNIIVGNNAQGKTNLIEAIWLFTGFKSFRGSKDNEFACFEKDYAKLNMQYNDDIRNIKANLDIINTENGTVKKAKYNNVTLKSTSGFISKFKCCAFSPVHLNIVGDGPGIRRRFLDTAISQLRPDYAVKTLEYEKIIKQRNVLLRNYTGKNSLPDTLCIWDEQLAKIGTLIHLLRRDYVKKLNKFAKEIYSEICMDKEILNIEYSSSVFDDYDTKDEYSQQNIDYYYKKLQQSQKQDLNIGSTRIGIHRDDLLLNINDISVKTYGSQGQKRSTVLALKMGEAAVIREISKTQPIILLDDVLSELDNYRKDYILNNIKDSQVFLTSCDTESIVSLKSGKVFYVNEGRIN